MIRAEIKWIRVEALATYQKLAGELQVRGLMRETLNDPDPYVRMRNFSTEPLLPGAPRLSGIPEGILNKSFICLFAPLEEEQQSPDEVSQERQRQFSLVQGSSFTIRGWAEFPPAADPTMRAQMLLRGRFFNLVDATIAAVGAEGVTWERPDVWVNRDLVLGLYMD